LHIVDMKTQQDALVAPSEYSNVEWLSPTSLLVAPSWPKPDGRPAVVKIVEFRDGKWAVREMVPKAPEPTPEQTKAADAFADDLLAPFRTYRDAVEARDLHQMDKAEAAYKKARDLLAELSGRLPARADSTPGPADGVLALTQGDLAPYLEEFNREANMMPNDRIVEIARSNLQEYIAVFLGRYYEDKKKLPDSMEELATHALGEDWQINHVAASDLPRAKRLLVIPGDDPDKVTTSYRIVSRDDKDGTIVVESPVLPNGRKLEATYKMSKNAKGNRVWFEPTIIEEPQ
jgi:hypothetical protein